MMNRSSSGPNLKRILEMIELMQTDLPDPVAPATRRCGMAARSPMTALP